MKVYIRAVKSAIARPRGFFYDRRRYGPGVQPGEARAPQRV